MVIESTTDKRASWNVDSTSSKPFPLLEALEPRLLLSGDGILAITPDPLDTLVDTVPQIVVGLLETNDQAEEQVPSVAPNANIYEPLFSLSVGDKTSENT